MRYLFLILLVTPSFFAEAQISYDTLKTTDAARYLDAVGYTFASPARWKNRDWIKLGGLLAGTAALTLIDQPARNFWLEQDSKFLDGVNTVGYHYGKPYSAFAFTGGFYLAGLVFKNSWAKETGLVLGASLLSAGLMEMTLKPAFGRARPFEGKGQYEVTFFNKEAAYHSFPSGHASMGFTISMVMARRVESVPLKIAFYSLAASTAVCRLYSDAHWTSDVAFGGAIAWFCSDVIIKRLEQSRFRPIRQDKLKLDVEPYLSGVSLRATF
jgi:membrane-associated phospholipid phosphatase